jgi:2-methylcitrate dehydratase PrpD
MASPSPHRGALPAGIVKRAPSTIGVPCDARRYAIIVATAHLHVGSHVSATGKLVAFVRSLDPDRLSAATLHDAVRCVLDLTGVAIAGSRTPMSRISARFAYDHYAPGNVTVIGSTRPLAALGATWINASYASALDMDDGNRIAMGHPGASVIPAALGIAEQCGAGGRAFLAAVVAGYDVAVRASAARVSWYKDKRYSTGIWGVFGATVAAGKLLGFDEATLQSALGTAGSHGAFPPGGLQANHAMVKETIAWSAMTGVASALLARDDFLGPADFFDYTERWDPSLLIAGLGDPDRYAIRDTYFKPYAVCRWAHAAVDAVLALKHRHDVPLDAIDSIDVESFWEITRLANCEPSNTIAAQFSIEFALAVALLYDRITPAEVTDAHIRDSRILALARKVKVRVDDEINGAFPAKTMARVTIHAAGNAYRTTVEYPRGNPENPMDDDELEAKFDLLTHDVIGAARARELRAAIRALPEANDVSALTRLLRYELPLDTRSQDPRPIHR